MDGGDANRFRHWTSIRGKITMKFSTKVFTVSGIALGAGSFTLGISDGVSVEDLK